MTTPASTPEKPRCFSPTEIALILAEIDARHGWNLGTFLGHYYDRTKNPSVPIQKNIYKSTAAFQLKGKTKVKSKHAAWYGKAFDFEANITSIGELVAVLRLSAEERRKKALKDKILRAAPRLHVSPVALIENKLNIRRSEQFNSFRQMVSACDEKIVSNEALLEIPFGLYDGIFGAEIIFKEVDHYEWPDYVRDAVPSIRERLVREKERDGPKIFLCEPPDGRTLDEGNQLHLRFVRGFWHHSVAIREAKQTTQERIRENGDRGFPFRLNAVAIVVSADKEFVWVKRNVATPYSSDMWGLPGESYDPEKDIHQGSLVADSAVRRMFMESDEMPVAAPLQLLKDSLIEFVALASYWNMFFRDLVALVICPISSKELISAIKSAHTEHSEFATMHSFEPEACFELLAKSSYEISGKPESNRLIADYSKIALLAALFCHHGYFKVLEKLRVWTPKGK